jgi:amino acid adenylation domain-containing protein
MGLEAGVTWSLADTEQSIPERFEEQALRSPSKIAIDGTSWRPSFAELDAAANRLAHSVLERGGEDTGRVALLLRHDAPLLAAVLGTLKAGKTAVALNPSDPPARLDRIRSDTEPQLVLTDSRHRDLALRAGFAAEHVATVAERPDGSSESAPGVPAGPDEVAFVIYTSGSTGRPKGVMQTHRNMLHNALRLTNGLELRSDDRIALLASLSGGQGVATTWTGLLNGATLCPFPIMERGVTGLVAWLNDHELTVFVASASVFRHFVRTLNGERLSGIRILRLGSESAVHTDFDSFRSNFAETCRFAHTLSSSEAGNITQLLLGTDDHVGEGRLPVGRPAEGIEVLLLDEHGAEVRPGDTGEIVVRSDYLSPGYWESDALTAERFVHAGPTGEGRLFRTGDLGHMTDGLLTVVGRNDGLVKVRGSRVELSEVETAITARPEVSSAVVCPTTTPRGDTKLTAYVTPQPGVSSTPESLRRALRATLPDHSVPTAFVFLESLPLDPHGGIDRARLALIEPPRRRSEPGDVSRGDTEELLSRIWSDGLELGRIGRDDDFFDLGGDSLTAAVVAAEVYDAFGVELELGAFAESPTVAKMAQLIGRLRSRADGAERPQLVRVPRTQPLPASFEQERTWHHSRTPKESSFYTMAVGVRIKGPLNVPALRRSVDHIVRRHEVLRTTFEERDGHVTQVVHPAAPVDIPLTDLSASPNAEENAEELLASEAREPFDLERGPLLRLRLVRIREDEHRLLRLNHHIISDGWSWRIFFEELSVLYEAYRRGESPPLADDEPLQYADFAAWERRYLHRGSSRYEQELAWWRDTLRTDGAAEPVGFAPLPFSRGGILDDAPLTDGAIWWGLRPNISRELERLGRDAGATFYMVRLALFAAQLAVELDRDDVVLASFVTKRRRTELQRMFGWFTNGTTIRLRFAGEESFHQWLRRVRAVVIETSSHSEVPYDQLLAGLRADGIDRPAALAIFGESLALPTLRFSGLEIMTPKSTFEHMPVGFGFFVHRQREADRCYVRFDPRVYEPSGVSAFLERFQRLAAAACAEPDRPLRDLIAQTRYARRSRTSLLRRLSRGRVG